MRCTECPQEATHVVYWRGDSTRTARRLGLLTPQYCPWHAIVQRVLKQAPEASMSQG